MKWIKFMFLLFCTIGFGQTVKVNPAQDPTNLVNTLLDNACVEISNAKFSSSQSVALFNNGGGKFPISQGVIIRSGEAKLSEGRYTGEGISSQVNSKNDADLHRINSITGQSHLITDVAFLEFDFVPLSSDFNFNFLFASNEYGEWQCVSSDVFAFLLTDLSTGETSNLAVIPNTDTPVSVRTIKDASHNASCEPDNPSLFGSYQVEDPKNSTLNMRGYTQVMNASAEITPGKPYRIRLVIGDSNDANYDSAIFLEAGSFSANVDLGEDKDLCMGDSYILGTGLDTKLYAHSWLYNGRAIAGETTNSLTVTQPGSYEVRVTKDGTSCLVTDEIVFSNLQVSAPKELTVCHDSSGKYSYDLSLNNEFTLGVNDEQYDVYYYTSYTRMTNNTPIPVKQLSNFTSPGNQKILMKIFNRETRLFCDAVYDFQLLVSDPIEVEKPQDIEECILPGKGATINLTQVESELLGIQDLSTFAISYFNSLENAKSKAAAIATPSAFKIAAGTKKKTIWVRVEDRSALQCYTVESFNIFLNDPPPVDSLEDVVECVEYILPKITQGNYYTGSGGTGTPLFAGDVITKSGTYYIFNGPDENGCTNESSFNVTIVESWGIGEKYCGVFTVPTPPEGDFFTRPGGPKGGGTLIEPGTTFTADMQIYYYAEVNGEFCRDDVFSIIILPLPPVDTPEDVVTCGAYKLPALQHGKYFTEAGGKGKELKADFVLTRSQTLYVYNRDSSCSNEHMFRVSITPSFEDVTACGSYELPETEVGSYFTGPLGQGTEIPGGTSIFESRTIYYFAETSGISNCTDKISFNVTVNPIPEVDELKDVLVCESETYKLPELTHGQYFTEANRQGEQLFAGQVISETTTIYINNIENGCANESSLLIEVRALPNVENFTDVYNCSSYTLPVLTHGRYFTGPGATGTEFFSGDVITATKTLYVYSVWPDLGTCISETAFTIYVEGIDVGDFKDITACDAYVLPALSEGNYFTESGGKGQKLKAGTAITSTRRIFVYASNGTRFICTDEDSFMVTVSYTPQLPGTSAIEACGSYTLSVITEYNANYYWQPGGNEYDKLSSLSLNTPGNYTVYVFATARENTACTNEGKINITIYPLLDLPISGGTICRNPQTGEVESEALLSSGLDPTEFLVDWYFDGQLIHTGPDYSASIAGDYTVKTTKLKPEVGAACNYKDTVVKVEHSAVPVIRATVSEPFENVAIVTIFVEQGFGDYQYQLNGGEFQTSNQFYDVGSGTHSVRVKGLTGYCGDATLEVQVLKFPKFFTPNGDGFNDTWTIPDLKDQPQAEIHVFDRYGKLLKVFPPTQGWDGFFHGKEMPSDDYWFRAVFEHEGVLREYKSHFTLKRI